MPYINLPPSLQTMFSELETRLLKLETAGRFTAPNVTTDPALPRKGDLILNTASNSLKYVDNSGAFVALGASSGVSSVSGTAPIVSSGGLTPAISLSTAGTAGTYTKVTTDTYGRVSSGTTLASTDLPTAGTAGTYTKVTTDTYGRVSSGTTLATADVPTTLNGTTFSGLVVGKTNTGGIVVNSNDTGGLSVRGDNSNAASISFHRPGNYAINLGLDTDNGFKIGGWSQGATPYFQINTSGHVQTPSQPAMFLDGNNGWLSEPAGTVKRFGVRQSRGGLVWNATTGQVTVPAAGYYAMAYNTYQQGGTTLRLYLRKNSGAFVMRHIYMPAEGQIMVYGIVYANASDTLDVYLENQVYCYYGGNHTYATINYLG